MIFRNPGFDFAGSFVQRFAEIFSTERFDNMPPESSSLAAFKVTFRSETAHRHGIDGLRKLRLFHELPTIPVGQPEIGDEDVAVLGGAGDQRVLHRGRGGHRMAQAFQIHFQVFQGVQMVFDDKDSHGSCGLGFGLKR